MREALWVTLSTIAAVVSNCFASATSNDLTK
jgi:hypothetical protein